MTTYTPMLDPRWDAALRTADAGVPDPDLAMLIDPDPYDVVHATHGGDAKPDTADCMLCIAAATRSDR